MPGHPARRPGPAAAPTPRANRSSWASLVMKTRSWSSLASWTAPTTRSPSFSEITSKSVALLRVVGRHPLDHPARGAQRQPGARPRRPRPARPRSRPARAPTNSLTGAPPARPGEWALGGSAGSSSTPSLISRPSEVTTATVPRAVAGHRRDDHVVRRPRPGSGPPPPRLPGLGQRGLPPRAVAGCTPAARPRTAAPARVVGHLQRDRGGPGRRRCSPAARCGAGWRTARRRRPARRRPARAAGRSDSRIAVSSAISACSVSRSRSSSSRS